MERLVNDSIVETLSKKIAEQVTENLREHWATVVSELASTRKSNDQLSRTLETLQMELATQSLNLSENLQNTASELEKTRRNNENASKILSETLKDLGIEE